MVYLYGYGRNETDRVLRYDREAAVAYAHEWAMGRNPRYYDFEEIGGDCTNFASQVLYAGSNQMNFTPLYGWYYINSYNRTPSWTGVEYLYRFLISNKGAGPFAVEIDITEIMPGDIIQISFANNVFSHSPVVVSAGIPPSIGSIRIAAHTYDRDNYPLYEYNWQALRFLHIQGVNARG